MPSKSDLVIGVTLICAVLAYSLAIEILTWAEVVTGIGRKLQKNQTSSDARPSLRVKLLTGIIIAILGLCSWYFINFF